MKSKWLTPFVEWGQKKDVVLLVVQLCNVDPKSVQVEWTNKKLQFQATGEGALGINKYGFEMNFFETINVKESCYKVRARGVYFTIPKFKAGDWPHLMVKSKSPHWLKLNFDLLVVEDSEEEESEDMKELKKHGRVLGDNIEEEIAKAKKDMIRLFINCYLCVYNIVQWLIYTAIAIIFVARLILYGQDSISGTYGATDSLMSLGQGLAFLEIVHPLFGLVRTGVFAPVVQVTARNTLLFLFVMPFKEMHTKWTVALLFFDWALAEFVRYPYYALSSVGAEVKWVTWLRYTCWMVFYPIGFVLEGAVGYQSSAYIREFNFLSLQLPNPLNFTFSFWPVAAFYPVVVSIGGPLMLGHMWRQRRKRVGRRARTSKLKQN